MIVHRRSSRRRMRRPRERLPLLHLLPSLVTIIGLTAGLTAIRYAYAGNFALSAGLILIATVLDGLDGLLARRLGSASPFGAELDSLCDFVDFGVAPGLLVYQMALGGAARELGWVMAMVYIVCCCLRLARFNVNRDAPTGGQAPHFVGVPAPAGALMAMLPVFLTLEGLVNAADYPTLTAFYLGGVGLLMVSRLPTFSPKSLKIPHDKVRWLLLGTAILVGIGLTRFWLLMILGDLIYALGLVRAAVLVRLRAQPKPPEGETQE